MAGIVNTSTNGSVTQKLITSIIDKVNDMDSFLGEIGYENRDVFLSSQSKNNLTSSILTRQYGADNFRVYSGRFAVPLKAKSNTHNDLSVNLSKAGKGLSFSNITVTGTGTYPIVAWVKKLEIDVVTIGIYTITQPTAAAVAKINIIGIALESDQYD